MRAYDRAPPPPRPEKRRRPWLIALPLAIFVVLAVLWTGFWFFAAHQADVEIARWRDREAQQGRVFACGHQDIGGYPFRIEVNCTDPNVQLRSWQPPVAFTAKGAKGEVQVYDPTLAIAEFTGPLGIGEPDQPPTLLADWSLAQTSFRGRPGAPDRLSVVLDNARLSQSEAGAARLLADAEHVELHGRMAGGTPTANPVIELGLRLTRGNSQLLPVLGQPTDGVMAATVYGLKDLAPKPWRAQLREIAQANGRIEITQARLTQGDMTATGTGTLSVTPAGRLDGQLRLTVTGLERLIGLLGLDQAVAQYMAQRTGGMTVDKLAGGLDRLMPGLGGVVRGQSGANLAAAGISLLGEPAELDGKRAIALPLRFTNGAVFLGPVGIGEVPPLF
ncbi:MAG: DUF2125 domain-containing protein [Xanthobacteraceae bacterium]|nr:DUF2125 domain-containing protein [Xanthobacteraceae bacterium]